MIFPKSITICGHDIEIIEKDIILDDKREETQGMAYFCEGKIEIALHGKGGAIASEDTLGETLVHEIVHHISEKFDLELSEKQVVGLGVGLHQVLKNHKIYFGID